MEDSLEENKKINILEKELKNLKNITKNISWNDFDNYEKLKGRIKEERRLLKILEKQASKKLLEEIVIAVEFLKIGSLISIKVPQINRKILPALICKKIYKSNKITNLLCLTFNNIFILIKPNFIINIFPDIDEIDISSLDIPEMFF